MHACCECHFLQLNYRKSLRLLQRDCRVNNFSGQVSVLFVQAEVVSFRCYCMAVSWLLLGWGEMRGASARW